MSELDVDQALAAALVRAHTAWPQLVVDDEAFVAAIKRGVAGAPEAARAIADLAIEDLYLARACATGAPAALDAFATLCDRVLHGCLRQMGLAPDVVDELVQDVRMKLFVGADAKIASYSGRAALPSWVRTIATRAAVDRLRKRELASENDDDELGAMPDAADSPELAHFRRKYNVEFKQAFEHALATLEIRDRNVLRHHFVDGLTVEAIGTLYGVHKATVSRWIEAARTTLAKRTRAGFQQLVIAMPAEVDSILALLQSQIDLSLTRVFTSA